MAAAVQSAAAYIEDDRPAAVARQTEPQSSSVHQCSIISNCDADAQHMLLEQIDLNASVDSAIMEYIGSMNRSGSVDFIRSKSVNDVQVGHEEKVVDGRAHSTEPNSLAGGKNGRNPEGQRRHREKQNQQPRRRSRQQHLQRPADHHLGHKDDDQVGQTNAQLKQEQKGVSRIAMDSLLAEIGAAASGTLVLPEQPGFTRASIPADYWERSGFRWQDRLPLSMSVATAADNMSKSSGAVATLNARIERRSVALPQDTGPLAAVLAAARQEVSTRPSAAPHLLSPQPIDDPWTALLSRAEANQVSAEAEHDLAALKARLELRKTLKFEIDAANAATAARAEAVKQTAAAAAAVRREEQLQVTRATVQQAAVSGLIGRVEAFMKEMSHKAAKEEAEYNRRLEELAVTQSPAAKMAAQTVKENDAQYTEVSASKWTIGQSEQARTELTRRRLQQQVAIDHERLQKLKEHHELKMSEAEKRALSEIARLKAREEEKRLARSKKLHAVSVARKANAAAERKHKKEKLLAAEAEADRKLVAASAAIKTKTQTKAALTEERAADARRRLREMHSHETIEIEREKQRAAARVKAGSDRASDIRASVARREARRGQFENAKREQVLAAREKATVERLAAKTEKAEAAAHSWELKMRKHQAKRAADVALAAKQAEEKRSLVHGRLKEQKQADAGKAAEVSRAIAKATQENVATKTRAEQAAYGQQFDREIIRGALHGLSDMQKRRVDEAAEATREAKSSAAAMVDTKARKALAARAAAQKDSLRKENQAKAANARTRLAEITAVSEQQRQQLADEGNKRLEAGAARATAEKVAREHAAAVQAAERRAQEQRVAAAAQGEMAAMTAQRRAAKARIDETSGQASAARAARLESAAAVKAAVRQNKADAARQRLLDSQVKQQQELESEKEQLHSRLQAHAERANAERERKAYRLEQQRRQGESMKQQAVQQRLDAAEEEQRQRQTLQAKLHAKMESAAKLTEQVAQRKRFLAKIA